LFGAAEAQREAVGAPAPRRQAVYQQTVERLRAALGPGAFATAWAAGRALPLAEAIVEAMTLSPPPHGSADDSGPSTPRAQHGLTPREVEVLRLVAAGRSNPEIAAALFISRRTAQTHVQHILDKLDVATRAEAAVFATQHGLLP
jgi:DNA-binding NarL/FixJ family response regulator